MMDAKERGDYRSLPVREGEPTAIDSTEPRMRKQRIAPDCGSVDAKSEGLRVLATIAPPEVTAGTIVELAMLRNDRNVSDPPGRLFLEQAIDLLCTRLVGGDSEPDVLD